MHFNSGSAIAVLLGYDVHVLKPSRSRFALSGPQVATKSYCCQDGCCDSGLRPDVLNVVQQAKAHGATRVILRTGQDRNYVHEIDGLPVSDVSDHVGPREDNYTVVRRW